MFLFCPSCAYNVHLVFSIQLFGAAWFAGRSRFTLRNEKKKCVSYVCTTHCRIVVHIRKNYMYRITWGEQSNLALSHIVLNDIINLYRTRNTAYCTLYTHIRIIIIIIIIILWEKRYQILNTKSEYEYITHWIDVLFRNGIPAQKALTKCHFMHERTIGRMVVTQFGSIAISFVHLL